MLRNALALFDLDRSRVKTVQIQNNPWKRLASLGKIATDLGKAAVNTGSNSSVKVNQRLDNERGCFKEAGVLFRKGSASVGGSVRGIESPGA